MSHEFSKACGDRIDPGGADIKRDRRIRRSACGGERKDLPDGAAMPLGEFQEGLRLCEGLPMRWFRRKAGLLLVPRQNIGTCGEIHRLGQGPTKEILMRRMIAASLFAALAACLPASPVRADDVKAGDLVISQAWSRATPGGAKVGGGYLTIENKGSAPDRLLGGSADIAAKVQVHEMSMNNGVMTMRPVDGGLVIEPGKTVKLTPGGFHLMLLDLKGPLKQGEKLPVTLEFEKAGKVSVVLDVQGIGAMGPAGAGQMDMKKMPDHSGMKM
jgi:periplasmic copper chaperone A